MLDDMMNLVAEQLYHRYRVQCNLRVRDLPFLMGQGLYMGSDKLKKDDRIEPAIKNGTLAIGLSALPKRLLH